MVLVAPKGTSRLLQQKLSNRIPSGVEFLKRRKIPELIWFSWMRGKRRVDLKQHFRQREEIARPSPKSSKPSRVGRKRENYAEKVWIGERERSVGGAKKTQSRKNHASGSTTIRRCKHGGYRGKDPLQKRVDSKVPKKQEILQENSRNKGINRKKHRDSGKKNMKGLSLLKGRGLARGRKRRSPK